MVLINHTDHTALISNVTFSQKAIYVNLGSEPLLNLVPSASIADRSRATDTPCPWLVIAMTRERDREREREKGRVSRVGDGVRDLNSASAAFCRVG